MGIEFLNNLLAHEISANRLVNKSVLEKNTELRIYVRRQNSIPVHFHWSARRKVFPTESCDLRFTFISATTAREHEVLPIIVMKTWHFRAHSSCYQKITRIIVMKTRHFSRWKRITRCYAYNYLFYRYYDCNSIMANRSKSWHDDLIRSISYDLIPMF